MPSREKLLARKRLYRERHLDEEKARHRRYREAHKDELAAANAEWRRAHPEAGADGVRRWRAANPDAQRAAGRAAACNRRAKAAGAPGHITRIDVEALWARQPACVRCGAGQGVDHIVDFRHGGANTPENLQNLCRTCNELKAGKLTAGDARVIRAALARGETGVALARRYRVSTAAISLIKLGRTWQGA